MNNVRVFEAFSGYGSQDLKLTYDEINHTSAGIAEIEPDAIVAYASIRFNLDNYFEYPSIEIMKEELIKANVGYDFKKSKSKIPRMNDKKLHQLYKAHILSKNFGDISRVDPYQLPDHDLFTYSFPCTDISLAGKQQGFKEGSGTSSSLLWECRKVITVKRPKILMMENVEPLVQSKHIKDFNKWLAELFDLGYNNYWQVVDASERGVPQSRKRVFAVSILRDYDKGTFKFPKKIPLTTRLIDLCNDNVDEKYYISTDKCERLLSELQSGQERHKIVVKEATTKGYDIANIGDSINIGQPNSKIRRGRVGKQVANTITTQNELCVVEPKLVCVGEVNINAKDQCKRVYNPGGVAPTLTTMQGGYQEPKILTCGNINPSGNGINGEVINSKGLSKTITTNKGEGPKVLFNYRIRKLTPTECLRLMGVKDKDINSMIDAGLSNSALYKLAGNSIVTNSMDFLKSAIKSTSDKKVEQVKKTGLYQQLSMF